MPLKSTTTGSHPALRAVRARAAYIELRGAAAAAEREAQIHALQVVHWRGKILRPLRCNGTTGRGAHIVNVPEGLLWSLIDLRAFRCPYHA